VAVPKRETHGEKDENDEEQRGERITGERKRTRVRLTRAGSRRQGPRVANVLVTTAATAGVVAAPRDAAAGVWCVD
jgi:hypothetical protein